MSFSAGFLDGRSRLAFLCWGRSAGRPQWRRLPSSAGRAVWSQEAAPPQDRAGNVLCVRPTAGPRRTLGWRALSLGHRRFSWVAWELHAQSCAQHKVPEQRHQVEAGHGARAGHSIGTRPGLGPWASYSRHQEQAAREVGWLEVGCHCPSRGAVPNRREGHN